MPSLMLSVVAHLHLVEGPVYLNFELDISYLQYDPRACMVPSWRRRSRYPPPGKIETSFDRLNLILGLGEGGCVGLGHWWNMTSWIVGKPAGQEPETVHESIVDLHTQLTSLGLVLDSIRCEYATFLMNQCYRMQNGGHHFLSPTDAIVRRKLGLGEKRFSSRMVGFALENASTNSNVSAESPGLTKPYTREVVSRWKMVAEQIAAANSAAVRPTY